LQLRLHADWLEALDIRMFIIKKSTRMFLRIFYSLGLTMSRLLWVELGPYTVSPQKQSTTF